MIKIAVCDDDSKCKETTKQLLQEYFSKQSEIPAKINGFSSGEELLEDVGFNGKYDVYVIDILMDTLNGIETARKLREKK